MIDRIGGIGRPIRMTRPAGIDEVTITGGDGWRPRGLVRDIGRRDQLHRIGNDVACGLVRELNPMIFTGVRH